MGLHASGVNNVSVNELGTAIPVHVLCAVTFGLLRYPYNLTLTVKHRYEILKVEMFITNP